MRWLSALQLMTRNATNSADLDWRLLPGDGRDSADAFGTVPIDGHGSLTGPELAAAGASLAARSRLPTIEELAQTRERIEVFVERTMADVEAGHLGYSYWDLQSAKVDANEEVATLAAEVDRLGRVEGAAVIGWVIRNAAIRAQRPVVDLARAASDESGVSDDAMGIAETLLGSAQRLDPTYGGFLFFSRPQRKDGLRFRGLFGHLWVYGD